MRVDLHSSDLSKNVMTVVLAGGQGTRLHPLTTARCKPAVSFGSRYRLIDIPLSNALNSGFRHIAIISQYFASDLNHHIASTYRLDHFQKGQFDLLCPEETPSRKVWFQGTADAVRQNLDHLLKTGAEYFLILSGDQLYNMDFRPMVQLAMDKQADLVIASIPVLEAEAKRMGLLKIDGSHQLIDFHEKPKEREILEKFLFGTNNYLGSMGIYVFKRDALVSILKEQGEDFGHHIIPAQVNKGKTFSFVYDGYWEDIGTINSYYQANLALIDRKSCLNIYDEQNPIYAQPLHLPSAFIGGTRINDSIIGQGSILRANEISHSIVGLRAQIDRGTVLTDSIVLGSNSSTKIGKNCKISRTIIDENTTLGDDICLTNESNLSNYDGDGIYIRDGIIIVTHGTHLPNGFIL